MKWTLVLLTLMIAMSSANSFAKNSSTEAEDSTASSKQSLSKKKTTKKGSLKNKASNAVSTQGIHSKAKIAKSSGKKAVADMLKKPDRASTVQVDQKKQTSLPSFNDKIIQAGNHTPVNLSEVKPPRTSSFMEEAGSDDKAKLEKITDQQIQELYKMIEKFKGSPRRGELWLRLAELYVEKAGIIDFRRQTDFDLKMRDFHDGKIKVKPRLDLADARDYNKKAVQLYEWFIRDFPKDEKMDQALFFLGYNYFELNESKRGLVYYTRLTHEYPSSPFITESHFALAEFYFEAEKWKLAGEHYHEITKHKHHRLYGFSTYKEAWCFFRSGRTNEALRTMELLIRENRELAQQAAEGKKVSKARLEKEALRDIVLFYANEGSPQKATEYFTNIAGSDASSYIEKLAYLYTDKGNRDGARVLFNYLIIKNPTTPKAFDYKYQVIQAYANATKTREFREELYSWVKDFGPSGHWYQTNKSNVELMDSSSKLRETTLKNWVLTQHQTAQNSHAKFSQGLAYEGYKVFLQEFPSGPATADMHFFFAELLYDMERYEEAGVQYRWVVDNAPTSKYGSKAAENIVLALEKNIPKDEEISATVGKSLDPVEFNSKVEKFVQVAQWYLTKFPKTDKTAEIKFRVGRLYYQHNQFDRAIPYFKEIVQNYPKTKYSEYSANLLLDIFNLKKDYAGLEKTGQELLAVPTIANSTAGADIRGVLEKAQFKKAQDLEINKDYGASAEQFESFAKQNAGSALVSAAHFNAGINYERAGSNGKAISNHALVLASKNKEAEPLKQKSRRILAKLYQDAGMIEEAAKAYRNSAIEAGADPAAMNLYFNAAILDEALGRNHEAVQNFQTYFDKSKKADRVEAVFMIAEINRRAGHQKDSAERYKEYFNFGLNNEKSVEASYRMYDFYKAQQKTSEAEVWKRRTLTTQKKLNPNKKGAGASWAAKVLLDESTLAFHELKNIKIPENPAKQKKAVQQKIDRLNDLNQKLAEIIKYDSPEEIVGALNLGGRANQQIGEAFITAPVPKGLKPDELKQYKDGIQKVADPFFAKAKESFKTALERSSQLEVYGKESEYARENLKKIDSSAVVDHGEVPMEIRSSSWMVD